MADWQIVRYDPAYEEKLDPEIIPLCDALNAAGFVTESSCCGHGRAWPHVCFAHSFDGRIEKLARFVMATEHNFTVNDDGIGTRPYFSMWQKEILEDGYRWSIEIHLNNLYHDTPIETGMQEATAALASVTQAVKDFALMESNI